MHRAPEIAVPAVTPSPLRGEGRVRGSVSRARSLRRNETNAEHVLWQIVRNRQLDGHKFVRQLPVGHYFADFACREMALALAGHPSPGERFAPATLSPEGRGSRGASAATTRKRSRRLTGGVARLNSE